MATMTIDDLVPHVQTRLNLSSKAKAKEAISKAKAKEAIQTVLGVISDTLADNQYDAGFEVRLHNFGTFKVKAFAAKASRNPSTGATIQLAARNKIVFKLTKSLADCGK